MTEQRFNELRAERVVYADHRGERTFLPTADQCPLCPSGDDRATEIPRADFEIAVFENRFAAFEPPGGACEVIVYTPDHRGSLGELSPARAEALMWVWRDRYRALAARAEVEYVLIFENRGSEVGVTLHHPHGQVYAFPFIPPVPAAELAADRRRGSCVICALGSSERAESTRVVYANEAVVAYVPWAARWPYEICASLVEHRPTLLECSPDELRGLADCLQAVARGYDALFARPFPYVMCVHQAPTDGQTDGHLHVEFFPPLRSADKLKYLAGCEQGAGTFLVDALPEKTAASLRAAIDRAG